MSREVVAWIGLGANLGDPKATLGMARRLLAAHEQISLLRSSSLYLTAPWGETDQPEFQNAVTEVKTSLSARQLLDYLLATEAALGRTRKGIRWGPRVIDLDLLLYGEEQICTETLTVPHPRLHQRSFVLVPLIEVEPELNIPGKGSASSCLEALEGQEIERVGDAEW